MKWSVSEALSDAAHSLLEADHELIAPDLLQIEASNALIKKVRRHEMSAVIAREAVDAIARYVLLRPSAGVFNAAVEIALTQGCTVYDAVYIALALNEECPLVTADERLVRGLKSALGDAMIWLGDMAQP